MDKQQTQAVFVYGSLRPDDDSGQDWTKDAVKGMNYQKATVKNAQMFQCEYATVVINRPGHEVKGYILTPKPWTNFSKKLKGYDYIEGYCVEDPDSSLYQRTITTAYLSKTGNPI